MKRPQDTRVLVAEDNFLIAELTKKLLEKSNYTVVGCASNGLEAVDMTRRLQPDVVIMDLKMPGVDGLEATRRIFKTHPTPVVALTAYDTNELVDEASQAGVGAYLTKPPNARELDQAITIAQARFSDMMALRRALGESERREAVIAALLDASRAVLAHREFEDAARAIFDSCKDLIGATAGYVTLLSKDDESEMPFLYVGEQPCTVASPTPSMLIRGLRAEAYATGSTVYENDFASTENADLLPEGHIALDSVLFAPIILDDTPVGLLSLANKPGGFDDQDALLAMAFSELGSIALNNSQMLESLTSSEERFRTVAQTAGDAIITANRDGNIIVWNQAAERMFGYTAAEIVSRPLCDIFPERFHGKHRELLQQIQTADRPNNGLQTVEWAGLRKDGVEFPLELSLASWKTQEGSFSTVIVRDITARREMEKALQDYSEQLEKMVESRTKDLNDAQEQLIRREKLAFLGQLAGGVGHELRNPLGVISNAVYFLQMTLNQADDVVKEYLDMIGREVQNAEKIISSLLNLSRDHPADRAPVAAAGLVADVLERYPPPKGVQIAVDVPLDLPDLLADAHQIGQVLANLVNNAYQAMSEGGSLTITAAAGQDEVLLSITDTGCGIPPENLQKIFEPLFTTKARGIGLGLAVSKKLVEVNEGRFQVESAPDAGSTFKLFLPIAEAGESAYTPQT
jgi:PAS domain S-box-containing protein